jgi:hypothetical protein
MSDGPSWGDSNSKEETMIDNVLSRRAILALAGLACVGWVGSATAATISFKVPLTGAEQVPPVTTVGKGSADLTWNPSTHVVTWDITDSGLTGPVTMAHFHNGAEGKNGPVVIWLTKKDTEATGEIKGEATLTADQAKQFEAGDWYVNLHTKDHPAGEIRGQVKPPKG